MANFSRDLGETFERGTGEIILNCPECKKKQLRIEQLETLLEKMSRSRKEIERAAAITCERVGANVLIFGKSADFRLDLEKHGG